MNKLVRFFIVSILSWGCTPFSSQVADFSGTVTPKCVGDECTVANAKFKKTIGIVKQSQALAAYKACLKLPDSEVSQATKDLYADIKPVLSAEGHLKTLTAPALMALGSLAGEICNDLIAYEAKGPLKFFKGFNLNGTTNTTSAMLRSDIELFAKSCWGRAAFKSEVDLIESKLIENKLDKDLTKGSALFFCTTMLSTPDVIAY